MGVRITSAFDASTLLSSSTSFALKQTPLYAAQRSDIMRSGTTANRSSAGDRRFSVAWSERLPQFTLRRATNRRVDRDKSQSACTGRELRCLWRYDKLPTPP